MIPPKAFAPPVHGGDLDAARRLFPGAPEPFLDLSTGISPHPYPIPDLSPHIFARLPATEDLARLRVRAAAVYGAPSESNVVPAAGTHILMMLLAGLVAPGRVAVLGPTYAEHARAASLAGHEVVTVRDLAHIGESVLTVVVNPNNPDGRMVAREDLLAIAERQRAHGGLLVVDEAFMDAGPRAESLAPHVETANVVVLRSFGKFFGLAGLRLGFALAAEGLASHLRAALGPWPLPGLALLTGTRALADAPWIEGTRVSLARAAQRLDGLLAAHGLEKVGGTSLFSLARSAEAHALFDRLGRAGICVRRFDEEPAWLRFGLPGSEADWQRLDRALRG